MTAEYEEIRRYMEKLKKLRADYEAACNAYRDALLEQWELAACYGYWNSDEPGTIYHYAETHNLNMQDIVYIVENGITEEEVIEWEDYTSDAFEFNWRFINLQAWHEGCPRVSKEERARLRKMQEDLLKAAEEAGGGF